MTEDNDVTPARGAMTMREAGRRGGLKSAQTCPGKLDDAARLRGGETTKTRYGREFYVRMGETTRDRHGHEFYVRIGRLGGEAVVAARRHRWRLICQKGGRNRWRLANREEALAACRRGGQTTLERYGLEHYQKMGQLAGESISEHRTPDERRDLSSLGGTARRDKYGIEHLREIGRIGAEKSLEQRRERKAEVKPNRFQELAALAAELAGDDQT